MTAFLQSNLRGTSLPVHFTMHSFRVGGLPSDSRAGTAVDQIMKIGGWKTETMAAHFIGPTTSQPNAGKRRKVGRAYDEADRLFISDSFRQRLAACV